MKVTKETQKKVKDFTKGFDFVEPPEFEMSVEDSVREIIWDFVKSTEAFEFVKVRLEDYNTPDFDSNDIFRCIEAVVDDFKGEGVIVPPEYMEENNEQSE